MRARFLLLIALLLSACTAPTGVPEDSQALHTEHVVLVIIDGLRYSEGLGDAEKTFTPRMHALAREGSIVEPFLNDGVTKTRRAVPAIWSGSWSEPIEVSEPECSGGLTYRATAPTVFEYYRKYHRRPQTECVYVLGEVYCPWQCSMAEGYGPEYWPRYVLHARTDLERWQRARTILQEEHPGFMMLYLPDVDHGGHSGDWEAYTQAVMTADTIVGQLWDILQEDPVYAGRTTLIVTNDHGRHDDRPHSPHNGFSGHGDGCHGCRTIQMLMVGPETRRGFVSTTPRTIPDIAPTVGLLLGFPTEQATGQPMRELLIDPIPHPAGKSRVQWVPGAAFEYTSAHETDRAPSRAVPCP
jgi:hypothetical protein